jgi:tetratricopeptide (TPR) repeat protein
MPMNMFTISLTVALAVCLRAAPAAAQQAELEIGGSQERPWAKGVPLDKQEAAAALFHEGNLQLKNSLFPKAVEKYREALKLWDHPAIHYNMALALLNLNEPLELHHHLTEAMHYGEAPLDKDKYERAGAFRKLIEQQLAHVEITCDAPGALVSMDGQVLFTAPGRHEALVRPGKHSITATKEGFLPTEQNQTLLPGEKTPLSLKLYTDSDLTRYRRPWSAWKPWALAGAGAALALTGSALHMQARGSFKDFDTHIAQQCAIGGCVPTPEVTGLRTRGTSMQQLAFGAYAVGGAALVTGAVLAAINRPQPYRINPNESGSAQGVSVTPLLGRGEGGVLAAFHF